MTHKNEKARQKMLQRAKVQSIYLIQTGEILNDYVIDRSNFTSVCHCVCTIEDCKKLWQTK